MGVAGLSLGHLLIVLVVIVLVFGTKKLRNIGGDLGAALRDFKAALGGDTDTPADRPPGQAVDAGTNRSAPTDAAPSRGQDGANVTRG